jgi:hypothetical protein
MGNHWGIEGALQNRLSETFGTLEIGVYLGFRFAGQGE